MYTHTYTHTQVDRIFPQYQKINVYCHNKNPHIERHNNNNNPWVRQSLTFSRTKRNKQKNGRIERKVFGTPRGSNAFQISLLLNFLIFFFLGLTNSRVLDLKEDKQTILKSGNNINKLVLAIYETLR